MLNLLAWGVMALAWVTLAGAAGALVLVVLRRWAPASRVARAACLAGLSAGVIALVCLLSFWLAPEIVDWIPNWLFENASQKARFLAETISEVLNCGAMALVASALAGILWATARWRLRRLEPSAG